MEKIRFSKGELKRQRDALSQYERFLPFLQLKKQQLQLEIGQQLSVLDERRRDFLSKQEAALGWAGLLSEKAVAIKRIVGFPQVERSAKNIAGVDLPVYEKTAFQETEYDLFLTPLWVDLAADSLRQLISLKAEIKAVEESIAILRRELRITTQRVNLFEKVKIPQAQEAIRLIKIYIGDQMANAVGRSKVAKRKIEATELEGALA
jgi:V/A-type H+-transporting ATPase subunit D